MMDERFIRCGTRKGAQLADTRVFYSIWNADGATIVVYEICHSQLL